MKIQSSAAADDREFVSQQVKSRYTKQEKLGEGTYGVVYKAIDNKTK
jgi:serine/threonine protein kinase